MASGRLMRILQVPVYAACGGLSLHTLTLSRQLLARGHEVRVLSMSDGPLLDGFREAGIESSVMPAAGVAGRRDLPFLLRAARSIRQQVADFRPDVVHSHGQQAHLLCALSLPRRQIFVASAHGSFRQFAGGHTGRDRAASSLIKIFQYGAMDRIAGWRSDRMVAVCEATRQELIETLRLRPAKVAVIPNGIEEQTVAAETADAVRRQLPGDADTPLVVFVGRIGFHKGCQDLVEAAAMVLKARPAVRFALVGEGPLKAKLEAETVAHGLAEHVIFTGQRLDAAALIAAADVVVLPSHTEGLPLTLLEAAMLAKPMVATSVGGVPEIVRAGETGLLVAPGEPAALAQALGELLADGGARQRLGDNARQLWEQRFTAAAMADGMEKLYRELSGVR
ncbi:MAG: glycosyltransferase family 4 protein [Thermoleophilia bacterium]